MESGFTKSVKIFFSSKRLKLVGASVLSTLLVGAGIIATYASFSDSGSSSLTASGGRLSHNRTSDYLSYGVYHGFRHTDMVPETGYSNTTTVTNNGNVTAKYRATLTNISAGSTIGSAIQVKVFVGSTQVYSGAIQSMSIPQQSLAPGASHQIRITASSPLNDNVRDSVYQTFDADLSFVWTT